jgi:acetylornithine deacetylase
MDLLERAIDLTGRLVAFDTESSKSNLPLIDFVAEYLSAQDIPFIRALNAYGDKAAIFATIGPQISGGVLLSGHTDVVPVDGQDWKTNPFSMVRDQSRLWGRGVVDMKAFGAVCLAMVPHFKTAKLSRPIHVLLSYDEETTCRGPLDVIHRMGVDLPKPAAVIVGEPTSMQVADAHKSVSTHITRVTGFEIHSANLHRGVSAVHIACQLVVELERIGAQLRLLGDPSGRFDPPWSSVHVGMIQGGTARNIVARDCAFHWEARGLPGLAPTYVADQLAHYVQSLHGQIFQHFPQTGIETILENEVPGLRPEIGSLAESLALRAARRNATIAVPYATEAGHFQLAGAPTVVCGPGSIEQAHQPNEFIDISQLSACIDFMQRLTEELSGN